MHVQIAFINVGIGGDCSDKYGIDAHVDDHQERLKRQRPQRTADAIHTFSANERKPVCGVIPFIRKHENKG